MYIIFGDEVAQEVAKDNKYIVLELDTIKNSQESEPITAYCVVDQIPLTEMAQTTAYVDWHRDLMADYKRRDWEQCLRTIPLLVGHFNGELDSFYAVLLERVKEFAQQPPDVDWSPVLETWR